MVLMTFVLIFKNLFSFVKIISIVRVPAGLKPRQIIKFVPCSGQHR